MIEALVLPTAKSGVILRELVSEADDKVYFESYNASRPEISVFDSEADNKHRTLEDTRQARLAAGSKIRMGIWAGDVFVGSANAKPTGKGLEIGYWIDSRHVGQGYATLGASALSAYMNETHARIYAETANSNIASQRVLQKSGFRPYAGTETGQSFVLADPIPVLFPALYGKNLGVPRGEYRLLQGSDKPAQIRHGQIDIITGDQQLFGDPFTGVHARGLYQDAHGNTKPIVSFLYHKLDDTGRLETTERAIIFEGVGFGEHPGHKGQPPTWYLVGPQIGTIDHETGEVVSMPQADVEIPAKHFSMACITDGPLHRLILANPQ